MVEEHLPCQPVMHGFQAQEAFSALAEEMARAWQCAQDAVQEWLFFRGEGLAACFFCFHSMIRLTDRSQSRAACCKCRDYVAGPATKRKGLGNSACQDIEDLAQKRCESAQIICNVSPCFIREGLYTANDSFTGRIDVATAVAACRVCAANHDERSTNEHVW